MTRTREVRRYRIVDGKMDEFIDAFQRLVVPVRRKIGFEVEAAWCNRESGVFTWISAIDGSIEDYEALDRTYKKARAEYRQKVDEDTTHLHAEYPVTYFVDEEVQLPPDVDVEL
ncbi:MAG TPA: NIPSNAP family protein [Candidatus Corynebacterium avicola]|uniref:NIPSNAP family protein n=1 Tax=Candidatus Corynebacterium avicola TaxID=2838527 RepID=A0A9D1RS71_9CORY|nr:NIPSNAP family protein [Candidatus Corynebacterium avicola]